MKKKIIIIGAGGHARSIIDVIEKTKKFKILFLLDKYNGNINGYKVVKSNKNILYYRKYTKNIVIGIGQIKDYNKRKKIFDKYKNSGFSFPVIKSPLAYISNRSIISEGTIIMHQALINANAKIGKNCIINTKALIEHDVEVGDNCHISTNVILNGSCKIDKNTFIGSGSIIFNNVNVGCGKVLPAGSIINRSL
jgi:sugar O-acyltransferase (sialic acid O-acetyltransferase NeuD family)